MENKLQCKTFQIYRTIEYDSPIPLVELLLVKLELQICNTYYVTYLTGRPGELFTAQSVVSEIRLKKSILENLGPELFVG